MAQDEIALSAINADELSKQVGDDITLLVSGHPQKFMVCGIYSDITNGGKTAKATFTHDPQIAVRTERILFMRDGKIVSELKIPKTSRESYEKRIEEVTEKMRKVGI